uniref:Uncharacterized protein n=1 Tax=Parastrongyloides trichosuri TaxID=131310 RepID=A0A0N4ZRT0_PARTI
MSQIYTNPWEEFKCVNYSRKKKLFKKVNYLAAIKDLKILSKIFEDAYGPEYSAIIHFELSKIFLHIHKKISSVMSLKNKEKCYWHGIIREKKYGKTMFSSTFLNWYNANIEIINTYENFNLTIKAKVSSLNFSIKLFKLGKFQECKNWTNSVINDLTDIPIFWYRCITILSKCCLILNDVSSFGKYLDEMKVFADTSKKRLVNDFFLRKIWKDISAIKVILNYIFPSYSNEIYQYNVKEIDELEDFSKKIVNYEPGTYNYYVHKIVPKYTDSKLFLFFCNWLFKKFPILERNERNKKANLKQDESIDHEYEILLKSYGFINDNESIAN